MDFIKSQQYIAEHRAETINDICRFLDADTLLFWDENEDLSAYQTKYWQPLLHKLKTEFGLDLQTTTGLSPAENEKAGQKFNRLLQSMSDKELTGCFLAASELKSVLLGLLLSKQKINAAEAFQAAYLEEIYQNKFWGEDVAALNAREKSKKMLENIEEYLKS